MATISGASFQSTVDSIYASASDKVAIDGFLDANYFSKSVLESNPVTPAKLSQTKVQDLVTGKDFILGGKDFKLGANIEDGALTAAAGGATIKSSFFFNTVSNDLTGNGLSNVLGGNDFNNKIEGAGGNDSILGGAGRDSISGGSGDDSILGGTGNDKMTGGSGNDVFVIGANDGAFNDVIMDFRTTKVGAVITSDKLVIEGHDFGDGLDRADFTIGSPAEGKGVLINFLDGGGSVLLKNINLNDLVFDDVNGSFELLKGSNSLVADSDAL